MKTWLTVLGTLAVALASAQASKARVDQIWSYANDRLDQQMDVWFADGEFLADIQLLRISTGLRSDDYDSWSNLGWMLENVHEWDAAVAVYKEFLAENPKDPDGALPLGNYYFRQKKYDLIPPILEPALGRTPHAHPNVYRILAHAYEHLGKLADAQRVWKQYIALAPKDDPARNNLARVEKKIAAAGAKQ